MASEQSTAKPESDQLVAPTDNMAAWPNSNEGNNMSPSAFYNPQPSPQDSSQQNPPAPAPEQPDKAVTVTVQNVDSNQPPLPPPPIALQESIEKQAPPSTSDPVASPVPDSAQPPEEEVVPEPLATDADAHADDHTDTIHVQQPEPVTESEPIPVSVSVPVSTAVPATVTTSATASPVVSAALGVVVATANAPKLEQANELQPLAPLAPASLTSVPMQTAPAISSAPLSTAHVPSQPGVTAFAPAGNTHPSIHPQPGQPLDLHENGNLLQQYGAPTAEAVDVTLGTSVGQTAAAAVSLVAQQMVTVPASQGMAMHVTQNGQPMPQPAPGHVRVVPGTGQAEMQTTGAPVLMDVQKDIRKTQRLPGTKQCPSCSGTIAAAVAKCPKCGHVFRAKKEKPKRSGKRGKKNCPKCNHENPSACSTCRKCKYVFRLKLMDRYKQMRPRTNDPTNPALAAAAHAHAASMSSQPMRPSAPMPAPAPLATAAVPVGGQDVIHYHTPNPTSQAVAVPVSQAFPGVSQVSTIAAQPVSQVPMTSTSQVNVVQHHTAILPQSQPAGIPQSIHPHQQHPSL